MKMKTLLLTPDYPPKCGGVARYLFELVQFFAPRASGEGRLTVSTTCLFARFLWPNWLPALWQMIFHTRTYDQLFISHVLPLGLVASIAQIITKKPYIILLHGMDFALARRNRWKRILTRRALRQARLIVTNTEFLEREVRGFIGSATTLVVYPCLAEEFLASSRVPNNDERVSKKEKIQLLTVARLVPRKGHLSVLEAIAILRDHDRLPSLHYHIVGDGPLYARILEHIKELRLMNIVTIHRSISDFDLIQIYRSSDIFVMPTEHAGKDIEGFGTVYIEAGAFGLPVIASDVPGVNEAVSDGETGILVPSGSVPDLADAIEILARNPERRTELGTRGRLRTHNVFTCQQQFGKLEEYL
ncbi:MAG: glycosyltransferase family 4 protein [Patescibacteria group bacterium]